MVANLPPRDPASIVETTAPYSQEFFSSLRDGALRSATEIVPIVLDLAQPSSVIDVGCGTGTWLAIFAGHGISDFLGVDGDYVDRGLLEIPADKFLPIDLRHPLVLERQFDLVVSLEVAEHLPPSAADMFVESLARLGPLVLFSAAIPCQGGVDHVNEQWPDYWAERFERHDFLAADAIRPLVWANANVESWYAQNSLFFVHRRRLSRFPALRTAVRSTKRSFLAKVHPRIFAEVATQNTAHRDKGDYYYAEATRLQDEVRRQGAIIDACNAQFKSLRLMASAAEKRSATELDDLRWRLTSTVEQQDVELRLRDARIAEQSAVLTSLEQDRIRLSSETERLAAEVSHWKAAADLPTLPLRDLLRGVWQNIARSLGRGKNRA